MRRISVAAVLFAVLCVTSYADTLPRMQYNHPGLTVDLGVGLWAWPLPMDFDGDGDLDLVVSCSDVPYNGTYFFENPGGEAKMPVFKLPVRVGNGLRNVSVSYVDGQPRVLTPGREWDGFLGKTFETSRSIRNPDVHGSPVRANQWQYVDYDGDGALDLVVGVGSWADYGWDDAFNEKGEWTRGPLHGYVYLLRNTATNETPEYAPPVKVLAGEKPVDVFGMPSPNFADFDGDGDLDLLCGEFLDGFTYFQNVGTRTEPRYADAQRLMHAGKPLAMDLQMITPTAVDWDADGDIDLIVGDEDGRVALVEHTGRVADGLPEFLPPKYFQQQARDLKFGALVTPVGVDFDGDGDDDLVCGNSAGYIALFENLDGGNPPRWAAPRLLEADGKTIRIQAGPNGSIQGPAEAKWGYTTLSVADWDHDGLLDLVVNSIWGKVVWYRNVGTKSAPKFAAAQPLSVQWKGKPPKPAWNWWDPCDGELATQWRTTPVVIDLDENGLNDLVMLDHEGYLAWFARVRVDDQLALLPPRRIFTDQAGRPLRLNDGRAGRSGRRKLCFADWDGDGRIDLLANGRNVNFFRNVSTEKLPWAFEDLGPVSDHRLAGHTTSPTTVDFDGDDRPDLVIGAEDGRFYYLENPFLREPARIDGLEIRGNRLEVGTLENDALAFGNRTYVWYDVPEQLRGWRFLRTCGGERSSILVQAKQDTTLYLVTGATLQGIDVTGWTKVDGWSFGYTDRGRTRVQVYQRSIPAGRQIAIPQGNWTGGILLIPPDAEPPAMDGGGTDPVKEREPIGQRGVRTGHDRRNVLFIATDDLRVELGCYGDTIVKSPNIDKLAARGTLFTRAYSQQAVCNPSRASLLTGLRPSTLDLWDLPTHFRQKRPDVVTLPQWFKQHGYFTQNIGKVFHNWRQDDYRGDPPSWSVPAVMHYNSHGNDKPMIEGELPPELANTPRCEMRDVPDEAYFDGRIAALAGRALEQLSRRDGPWFLAMGFWKPHAPFNAPKRYWDLYDRSEIGMPANPQPPQDVPPIAMHDSREILRGFKDRPGGKPTSDDVLTLRHGYCAAVSYVDAQIGKLLDQLDRLGLAENTIIVLWSDHGYHLGEHALWAKTSNFELDARVPMIIATPNHARGQRTDALVELLDLYPTLVDLCGLPTADGLDGVSLRPLLENPTATVKPAAFTWHPRPAYPAEGTDPDVMGYSMRTDRYRYTEWRDFETGRVVARELYDHADDPRETVNRVARPELADTVESLAGQLAAVHPKVASAGGGE